MWGFEGASNYSFRVETCLSEKGARVFKKTLGDSQNSSWQNDDMKELTE
jgi:hypothetical protein